MLKFFTYRIILAAAAFCMSFVSSLQADSHASIEIVGIKLIDKDRVIVEAEAVNLSNENITISPYIWVRTATLKGQYISDPPVVMPGVFRINLTIYADLTLKAVPGQVQKEPVYAIVAWEDPPASGSTPPIVLKPGEKHKMSVQIPMSEFLVKDFRSTLSKDIWVRVGMNQSGGQPTSEEESDLVKQKDALTPIEWYQAKDTLLKKYAPVEFTHGNLYKLELPKDGESLLRLVPIKAPF